MRQRCEVCESHHPDAEAPGDRNTHLVPFDARPVVLCAAHAAIAERNGVTSFDGLRELYGSGRRSFVPRRGRDVTTAAGDRRDSPGRRAADQRKSAV